MNGYERDVNYLALILYITWAITGNSALEPVIAAILLASFLAADFFKKIPCHPA